MIAAVSLSPLREHTHGVCGEHTHALLVYQLQSINNRKTDAAYCLDYFAERKSLTDLVSSIFDGRYDCV